MKQNQYLSYHRPTEKHKEYVNCEKPIAIKRNLDIIKTQTNWLILKVVMAGLYNYKKILK